MISLAHNMNIWQWIGAYVAPIVQENARLEMDCNHLQHHNVNQALGVRTYMHVL